jgi:hypothetical protein
VKLGNVHPAEFIKAGIDGVTDQRLTGHEFQLKATFHLKRLQSLFDLRRRNARHQLLERLSLFERRRLVLSNHAQPNNDDGRNGETPWKRRPHPRYLSINEIGPAESRKPKAVGRWHSVGFRTRPS